MTAKHSVTVSLNFTPSFYHKHLGVTYGEPYYFEPRYRSQIERAENRFLYEILGRFGVGSAEPAPSTQIFIQPVDLVKITQGSEIHCPSDATLETLGQPWAGLTVGQIERIDAQDAARHPIIDALVRQYHEIEALYGGKADAFGIKTGVMDVHTPYTTAHQLCGESLFLLLMDDPAAARRIFAKIWEIYRAIFERLVRELGVPFPNRLAMGDCSASLLSDEVYRAGVLPVNQAMAAEFSSCTYHSCGRSSHLLPAFATISGMTTIQLGAGTDIAAAVRVLPGVEMQPMTDPVLLRSGTAERVRAAVAGLIAATAAAPSVVLLVWALDRDTPVGNVEALYETVPRQA